METNKYPFYIKSTVIIAGLVLLSYALYHLATILIPIAFSFVIAILINPLVNKLQQKGVKKLFAISIVLLITLIIIFAILYFISSQLINFADNLPQLKIKFAEHFKELQNWIAANFNIPVAKQNKLINDTGNNTEVLGKTLGSALGIIGGLVLIPIYVFLLLYYKILMINFLHEIFVNANT